MSVRASSMLATALVGAAILAAGLGLPRTAAIVLSAAVALLIRSIETLRTTQKRPEN